MTYGEFAWKDLMRSALRDRGPVALLLSALGPVLGRSPERAGEARIDDLRLLTDPRLETCAEIRIWMVETPAR